MLNEKKMEISCSRDRRRGLIGHLVLGIALTILVSCGPSPHHAWQWRGMERNGIYPDTGLLSSWPAGGPELLWYFEGLGQGHGSVSFGKDRVFVLGMPDTMGVLYAFSLKGDLLWQQEYGP